MYSSKCRLVSTLLVVPPLYLEVELYVKGEIYLFCSYTHILEILVQATESQQQNL